MPAGEIYRNPALSRLVQPIPAGSSSLTVSKAVVQEIDKALPAYQQSLSAISQWGKQVARVGAGLAIAEVAYYQMMGDTYNRDKALAGATGGYLLGKYALGRTAGWKNGYARGAVVITATVAGTFGGNIIHESVNTPPKPNFIDSDFDIGTSLTPPPNFPEPHQNMYYNF